MGRIGQAFKKAALLRLAKRDYCFRFRPGLFRLFEADVAFLAAQAGLFHPLVPTPAPPPRGTVLVVAPHPDDEAVGCGGALILARDGGAKLTLAFLTDGEDGTVPPEESVRVGEAKQAAAFLDAELRLFHNPVRALKRDRAAAEETAAELADLVASLRPDHIFVPFALDSHSDHRVAAWATARAVEAAGSKAAVWGYEVVSSSLCPANVIIDISAVEGKKATLIGLYRSQLTDFDYINATAGLNRYHSRHLGGRGVAEAFFRLPAEEYINLIDRMNSDQIFSPPSEPATD